MRKKNALRILEQGAYASLMRHKWRNVNNKCVDMDNFKNVAERIEMGTGNVNRRCREMECEFKQYI